MDDNEARQLLQLLHKYMKEYGDDIPKGGGSYTVDMLAFDLAESLDDVTDEDIQMRSEIEAFFA